MLQNAYLDAKIGFDPAENMLRKDCCVVAASWTGGHRAGARLPGGGQVPQTLGELRKPLRDMSILVR